MADLKLAIFFLIFFPVSLMFSAKVISKPKPSRPQYVRIEAGNFLMGSPKSEDGHVSDETLHRVTISRPFLMKVTEVTVKEWTEITPDINPYGRQCSSEKCPLTRASWLEVLVYANKLSIKEGFKPCYNLDSCGFFDTRSPEIISCSGVMDFDLSCEGYRLPTEAEWEYAYRAGTTTKYYSGDKITDLDRIAWHGEEVEIVDDAPNGGPHPVGLKEPNKLGLYDMSGNLSEWVWDSSPDHKNRSLDPKGLLLGTDHYRAYRGGSWRNEAKNCRAARLLEREGFIIATPWVKN